MCRPARGSGNPRVVGVVSREAATAAVNEAERKSTQTDLGLVSHWFVTKQRRRHTHAVPLSWIDEEQRHVCDFGECCTMV